MTKKGNKTFLLHSGSIDAIDIYHKAQQNLKLQKIIQNSSKNVFLILARPQCEMEVIADVWVYEGQKRRI